MALFQLPYDTIRQARFDARPNRFVVEATLDSGEPIRAFMPNPGRLWELLLPEARLWVAPQSGAHQKLRWLVLAVERDGAPIFLHTHINNNVARFLLENQAVPGFEAMRIVRTEATVGRSRFDFLLEDDAGPLYLEVKSCTLFANGVAMFPDAVTERGKRHLEELAQLAKKGVRSAVLFIVHSPNVQYFMPDYHTDLAFSETLLAVRHLVQIAALSIAWRSDLSLLDEARPLQIPYDHIAHEMADCGIAMVLFDLTAPKNNLPEGRKPGYYLYVEAASAHLESRMHSLRKGLKDAPDAIRMLSKACRRNHPIAIRSSRMSLKAVRKRISGMDFRPVDDSTNLFFMEQNPLLLPAFHTQLARWRLRQPGKQDACGIPEKA